jgi:hypothetical protein
VGPWHHSVAKIPAARRDLAFQEAQLQEALERHGEQQAAELRIASAAPTLAPTPAPDPLLVPYPHTSLQSAPFTAAAMQQHPFFGECAAAAAAQDPDVLLARDEGAMQADSDDEVVLATLANAFGGLADRAAELDAYLRAEVRERLCTYAHASHVSAGLDAYHIGVHDAAPSGVRQQSTCNLKCDMQQLHVIYPAVVQLHSTGTAVMRAPAKAAPRKGVRPIRPSLAGTPLGHHRRTSSDTPRDAKKRRVEPHPLLPANLLAALTAPKPKGPTGVYVPMARKLEPEEIQAQIDAESSGDEAVSDSHYVELHAKAQQLAEAERGAPEAAWRRMRHRRCAWHRCCILHGC